MNIAWRFLPWLACLLTALASATAHPGGPTGFTISDAGESAPELPGTIRLYRTPTGWTPIGKTFVLRTLRFGRGQPEPKENVLTDTKEYVTASGPHTRCGKYFVLETKKYGEFEVKQVHVAYLISSGVAVLGLYYSDLAVVFDEAKRTPALLQKRENPGLQKDTIRLSRAAYEEAKACLPPPEAK